MNTYTKPNQNVKFEVRNHNASKMFNAVSFVADYKALTTDSRRANTAKAFEALKTAGSMVANDYAETCLAFWYVDNRNVHMLENWLNSAKRFPRILSAARKLLPSLCGVVVKGDASKGFTVENLPDISKKQATKLKAECKALYEMQLTSLLNHPKIKVKVEPVWVLEKETTKLKNQLNRMLEKGVSVAELFHLVEVALTANEKAEKDNVKPIKAA